MYILAVQNDFSLSSVYGVIGNCSFTQLFGFTAVSLFPPDVMHYTALTCLFTCG